MTIKFNYNLLKKEVIFELANLTEANINLGATSTVLKCKPSYIIPNGKIYYITTNHHNSNFYIDIERCFDQINNISTQLIEVQNFNNSKLLYTGKKLYKETYYILDDEIICDDIYYNRLTKDIYDELCHYFNKKLVFKSINGNNYCLYDRLDEILKSEEREKLQVVTINLSPIQKIEKRYIIPLEQQEEKITKEGITELDVAEFINYDKEKQKFVTEQNNQYIDFGMEREYQKEVQLIKKCVPYDKRHLYFK